MAEATLLLINSTIYDFQLSYQHQYQMENWDFPALIATGKSAQIPIGFHHGLYSMDDGAEATYSLKGGSSQFTLQARAPDRDFRLYFDGSDLQNDGHSHPRELLGWSVNQKLVLWISGTNTGYVVRHFWR